MWGKYRTSSDAITIGASTAPAHVCVCVCVCVCVTRCLVSIQELSSYKSGIHARALLSHRTACQVALCPLKDGMKRNVLKKTLIEGPTLSCLDGPNTSSCLDGQEYTCTLFGRAQHSILFKWTHFNFDLCTQAHADVLLGMLITPHSSTQHSNLPLVAFMSIRNLYIKCTYAIQTVNSVKERIQTI